MVVEVALLAGSLLALWPAFAWLERRFATPQEAGRRRRDTLIDVACWFAIPLLTGVATRLTGIEEALRRDGAWTLRDLPLGVQAIAALVASDLVGYASHRLFHGRLLWPIHAVHHGSDHLDWLSSARFHPLNDVLSSWFRLAALSAIAFDAERLAPLLPIVWLHLIVIHADLPFDYGPVRHVIVSPRYHRWHHTLEGCRQNYASVFPFIDRLFGTHHLPATPPSRFGLSRVSADDGVGTTGG